MIGVEVLIFVIYDIDISIYDLAKLYDDGRWLDTANEDPIIPNYWQPLLDPPETK